MQPHYKTWFPATVDPLDTLWLVTILAFVVTFLWARCLSGRKLNLPPGPRGTPILGYLPFLGMNHHVMFSELSKTYGPILRIRIGTVNVVALSDIESIKKGLNNPVLQNRLRNVFLEQTGYPGVGTLNGKAWRDNRQLSMRILHDLGLGRSSLESVMQEEIRYLTKLLARTEGQPVFVRRFTVASLSNVITRLLFGVRYSPDDPERIALDKLFVKAGSALSTGSLVVFLPSWMYRVAAWIPFTRIRAIKTSFGGLLRYIRNQATVHEETLNPHHNRDYIDAYLKLTKEFQGDKEANSNISKKYIPGNVLSFFGAGTNAVNRSIVWNILNCADKPDTVQKRIQQEIDEVIGQEREPAWADRLKMPYTMAAIAEMHRWKPVTPLGLPRGAVSDTEICGYDIPKGTIVMANLWSLSMNPSLWESPEIFDPNRFLEEGDSKLKLKPKPEHYIPFSHGKRMCPAEALSSVEGFLYLTGILQKFRVLPEEGTLLDLTTHCVTFNSAKPQRIRFILRDLVED